MKKILLVGQVNGAYRTQSLIDVFTEYTGEQDPYVFTLVMDTWYSVTPNIKNPVLKGVSLLFNKILNTLLANIELFFKSLWCDVIYITAMNHKWIFPAVIIKFLTRKPLVVDFYISRYTTSLDRDEFKKRSFLDYFKVGRHPGYAKFLDRLILEQSTRVVHTTKTELQAIAALVGARLGDERIKILPLAIPARKQATLRKSKVFKICWWGTWIPLHGIESMLDAARLLKEDGFSFHLTLFGTPDPKSLQYENIISQFNLNKEVTIETGKTFANGLLEAELMNNCDLALSNFGNSAKASMVITNKLIDALAMGLPVLTMKVDVLNEFIDCENEIFVCAPTPSAIAEAIINISYNDNERCRRAKAGFKRFELTFSLKNYSDSVRSMIDELLSK